MKKIFRRRNGAIRDVYRLDRSLLTTCIASRCKRMSGNALFSAAIMAGCGSIVINFAEALAEGCSAGQQSERGETAFARKLRELNMALRRTKFSLINCAKVMTLVAGDIIPR